MQCIKTCELDGTTKFSSIGLSQSLYNCMLACMINVPRIPEEKKSKTKDEVFLQNVLKWLIHYCFKEEMNHKHNLAALHKSTPEDLKKCK